MEVFAGLQGSSQYCSLWMDPHVLLRPAEEDSLRLTESLQQLENCWLRESLSEFFCSADLSGRNQHALQNGKGLGLIGTIRLFSHALSQNYPLGFEALPLKAITARLWLAQAISVCPGPCTYWYTVTHLWYLQPYSIGRVLPSLGFPAHPTSNNCRVHA